MLDLIPCQSVRQSVRTRRAAQAHDDQDSELSLSSLAGRDLRTGSHSKNKVTQGRRVRPPSTRLNSPLARKQLSSASDAATSLSLLRVGPAQGAGTARGFPGPVFGPVRRVELFSAWGRLGLRKWGAWARCLNPFFDRCRLTTGLVKRRPVGRRRPHLGDTGEEFTGNAREGAGWNLAPPFSLNIWDRSSGVFKPGCGQARFPRRYARGGK